MGVGRNRRGISTNFQSSSDRTSTHTPYMISPPKTKPSINPVHIYIRPNSCPSNCSRTSRYDHALNMCQRLIPLHPVTQYEGATQLSVGERVVGRENALCLGLSRVAPLRA